MIFTSLNANTTKPRYPDAIMRAIAWLKKNKSSIQEMAVGEYCIEGRQMFAKVFDVDTKSLADTKPEIHKKYVDVQYWHNGEELMGFAPATKKLEVCEACEAEDLYFLYEAEDEVFIPAHTDDIMVLFPEDIHRPAVCKDKSVTCRKVVIKVSIDLL